MWRVWLVVCCVWLVVRDASCVVLCVVRMCVFVVCCLLFVDCCLLFVLCCLLFVLCCLLSVSCCLLSVSGYPLNQYNQKPSGDPLCTFMHVFLGRSTSANKSTSSQRSLSTMRHPPLYTNTYTTAQVAKPPHISRKRAIVAIMLVTIVSVLCATLASSITSAFEGISCS